MGISQLSLCRLRNSLPGRPDRRDKAGTRPPPRACTIERSGTTTERPQPRGRKPRGTFALGFAGALHRAMYARFHGLRFFSLFARTSFLAHFASLPQPRARLRAGARVVVFRNPHIPPEMRRGTAFPARSRSGGCRPRPHGGDLGPFSGGFLYNRA